MCAEKLPASLHPIPPAQGGHSTLAKRTLWFSCQRGMARVISSLSDSKPVFSPLGRQTFNRRMVGRVQGSECQETT